MWAGPCGAGACAFIIRSTLPAARCARSRAGAQKSLRARGTRSERVRKYPNSSHTTAVLFGCSQKMSSELSSRTTERMLLQRLRAPKRYWSATASTGSCSSAPPRDITTCGRGSRSVEMQHALEVTEPSHPYAHLYSRYLAAYGALAKKHYEQFGVEPRRIIE